MEQDGRQVVWELFFLNENAPNMEKEKLVLERF